LPYYTYAAYACNLTLELFAFYTAIAFNNNKKEKKMVKNKKLILMPKLKATFKKYAF
jgi:hypothetical protein